MKTRVQIKQLAGFCIFSSLIISSLNCFAWGLLNNLRNEDIRRSTLYFKALNNKRIRYCVDIADRSAFKPKLIDVELRTALGIWLEAFELSPILEKVSCSNPMDLVVEIGPEVRYKNVGSYHAALIRKEHLTRYIKLNTDMEHTYDGKTSKIVDFASFYPAQTDLKSNLKGVSENRESVISLSAKISEPPIVVYWSTYRILIHELGHAFGLCDTKENETAFAECDKAWKSEIQPPSVMRETSYFYLLPDDVKGVNMVKQYLSFKLDHSKSAHTKPLL